MRVPGPRPMQPKQRGIPDVASSALFYCLRSIQSTTVFSKVLIANRGEIALRIIRTLREMGIRSVAVYSDIDRAALHVRKADEAAHIGPAASHESYLNIDRILDAARRHAVEAIHPGYGFLSENPRFAQACEDEGFNFIGPSPRSISLMGSKTEARRVAKSGGAPIVPGTESGLNSAAEAAAFARHAGFPVMLKAVAGGGGKGMRHVDRVDDLSSAFDAASSEAARAFGDGRIYAEKLIENARHIEIQVLGDKHGNLVHLGERECSVQRRHQKVIEESPSPLVARMPGMRERMGEAALNAARAAGYYNAGTVEFLADNSGNFYFLEMNTRLQVEHPVTELVTGLDLVRLQIQIAAGERLPFTQDQVVLRGSAIECRIYAEDPANNFFPSPGRIEQLSEPAGRVFESIPAFILAGPFLSNTTPCSQNSSSGPTAGSTPLNGCCGRSASIAWAELNRIFHCSRPSSTIRRSARAICTPATSISY